MADHFQDREKDSDQAGLPERRLEQRDERNPPVAVHALEYLRLVNVLRGVVYRDGCGLERLGLAHEPCERAHEIPQLDGFDVGPVGSVTLAHLKGTFDRFYREYFGPNVKTRFRPSFFGFTEPSVEIDMWFEVPGKEGRWLEMCGAGMLHPSVIKNAGLDPEKIQGFAFGGGLERLIMVKYGIPDVRLFHSGDIRFSYGFLSDDTAGNKM